MLFAATVQAADSRQHFIHGNPDSDNSRRLYMDVTAVQPGVGADISRYQGIADGNPDLNANRDLFSVDLGTSPKHQLADI